MKVSSEYCTFFFQEKSSLIKNIYTDQLYLNDYYVQNLEATIQVSDLNDILKSKKSALWVYGKNAESSPGLIKGNKKCVPNFSRVTAYS